MSRVTVRYTWWTEGGREVVRTLEFGSRAEADRWEAREGRRSAEAARAVADGDRAPEDDYGFGEVLSVREG